MNEEIKDIEKIFKQDEYNMKLNSVEVLGQRRSVQKVYKKETGKHNYFVTDIITNEPILDKNKNGELTPEYIEWLTSYREIIINRNKKLKCSNCEKIINFIVKEKPCACPECQHPYWDKPDYEFKLFVLQDEYFKTRSNDILSKMYEILKLYAKKMIVKKVSNRCYFKKEDLEIKAHDSANKAIMYYMTKPSFIITDSFGGYLNGPILNVLYAPKKEDSHDSLNSMIDNENEFGDYVSDYSSEAREKMRIEFDESLEENISCVSEIIHDQINIYSSFLRRKHSLKEAILTLIGLKNKIKGYSDNNLDDYYLYAGGDVKKNVDKAMSEMYKKLKTLHN